MVEYTTRKIIPAAVLHFRGKADDVREIVEELERRPSSAFCQLVEQEKSDIEEFACAVVPGVVPEDEMSLRVATDQVLIEAGFSEESSLPRKIIVSDDIAPSFLKRVFPEDEEIKQAIKAGDKLGARWLREHPPVPRRRV